MGKGLYPPGAIFCRTCGYCLHGLPEPRCPECGHGFDPADPATFLRRPRRLWPRRLLILGAAAPLLALAYGGFLGWLYLGCRAEAGARALKVNPDDMVQTRPILPSDLAWLLPPLCRPWLERVDTLELYSRRLTRQEVAAIAACRRLKTLRLHANPLTGQDLGLIVQCRELEDLRLYANGLTGKDAAGLVALKRLRVLSLPGNTGLDDSALEAVGQLKGLRQLFLQGTPITDEGLAHLAGLTNLEALYLGDCPRLTDRAVPHLSRLTGLKTLYLRSTRLTHAAVEQLKNNLPQSTIEGP